ncbi:transposase [Teichococcus wenyumeiae]|nr:transposase [Pseudoroseomonas wenyumeiae]
MVAVVCITSTATRGAIQDILTILGPWLKMGSAGRQEGLVYLCGNTTDRGVNAHPDQPHGGRISKIHAVANAEGRPLAFVPMPGNIADISAAAHLLDSIAPARRILADKAYDADHLRKPLEAQGTEVVIPSTRARRRLHLLNRRAYRGRNLIERMFGRMKDCVASPPAMTVSPGTSCLPSHSSQPFASGSPD